MVYFSSEKTFQFLSICRIWITAPNTKVITIMTSIGIANQGDMLMGPSEATASRIYDVANNGSWVGLTVGLICTVLSFWMGSVKEKYSNQRLATTSSRAVAAEGQVKQLQDRLRWRTIGDEQAKAFLNTAKTLPKEALTVSPMTGDPETVALAGQFVALFTKAGWVPTLVTTGTLGLT
jgi:hypothetical protein